MPLHRRRHHNPGHPGRAHIHQNILELSSCNSTSAAIERLKHELTSLLFRTHLSYALLHFLFSFEPWRNFSAPPNNSGTTATTVCKLYELYADITIAVCQPFTRASSSQCALNPKSATFFEISIINLPRLSLSNSENASRKLIHLSFAFFKFSKSIFHLFTLDSNLQSVCSRQNLQTH